MHLKYTVLELATAVKPTFLSHLVERYGEAEIIYLDPDILVMRPFEELRALWSTADIVLTPHLLQPLPNDGLEASERSVLIAGSYNLGFIAVRAAEETQRFLNWWAEHLRDDCRVDPCRGLMVDQRWIDLAPHLFPASVIALRDDTYNVAYWNLHSRTLEKGDEAEYLVNGRPLTFFHFSGFDPTKPRHLSKHQNRIQIIEGTALADLTDHYARLLMDDGFAVSSKWTYESKDLWGERFDNGIRTNPILRQLYAELEPETRARFGDPRRTDGADSFFAWATTPRPEAGGLSPFLEAVYRRRPDLAAAFPDPGGRDRAAFLNWARHQGAQELRFDPRLGQDDPLNAT